MASSIFSAMSRLKSAGKTWSSLPIVPSTERTNGDYFLLLVTIPTVIFFLLFLPPIQERFCWILVMGLTIWIPPVWCKLCHQSGSPISPLWGRHLLFPKRPSLDIPPHLICCRPGEWGDLRICSYIISLSLWSVWPHFTLCYDVRWWSPCSFSWFSEARKRAQVNHRTFGVWGGVNIVTCTQKSQKSVADSTVPVNLVPCMFIP